MTLADKFYRVLADVDKAEVDDAEIIRRLCEVAEEHALPAYEFLAEQLSIIASQHQGFAAGVRWWALREDTKREYLHLARTTVAEWVKRERARASG